MRIEIRPAFDEAVMRSQLPTRKAAAKLINLLQAMDLVQIWQHPGLNFEKLQGMIEPVSGEQLYSLRVTGSARAISCLLKGPTIVLVTHHTQHDNAYKK